MYIKFLFIGWQFLISLTDAIFIFAGNVVNKPEHGSLDWVKICEKSSKVITFIDLAGHERYLKTTVFGMTGHAPDFGKNTLPSFAIMQFDKRAKEHVEISMKMLFQVC